MIAVSSSHSIWVFGWALTGALAGVVGMFFMSAQAHSRSLDVEGVSGPLPPIDRAKPGKYETATFGMG